MNTHIITQQSVVNGTDIEQAIRACVELDTEQFVFNGKQVEWSVAGDIEVSSLIHPTVAPNTVIIKISYNVPKGFTPIDYAPEMYNSVMLGAELADKTVSH